MYEQVVTAGFTVELIFEELLKLIVIPEIEIILYSQSTSYAAIATSFSVIVGWLISIY